MKNEQEKMYSRVEKGINRIKEKIIARYGNTDDILRQIVWADEMWKIGEHEVREEGMKVRLWKSGFYHIHEVDEMHM